MKNILKNLILTFAISVLFIGTASAATVEVGGTTVSPKTVNGSVSVELKDSDLRDYSQVSFQLTVSGIPVEKVPLTFTQNVKGMDYSYDSSQGAHIIKASNNSDGTAGSLFASNIATVSFTVPSDLSGNFTIVPTNVKFTKLDGTTLSVGDAGIKANSGTIKYERAKSTEANITNLTVSQGTLSPEFNPSVRDYTVKVKDTINSLRIGAEVSPGATRTGTGTKPLSMGENNVEIVVTAEDGVTKNTYNITIIRGEIAEPSAYLKSLDVNNIGIALTPEFDSKNDKYTVTVGTDIKKLEFKYETEDPLAKVEIDGNDEFKLGENEVVIKVTSSDEAKTQEYKVTVIVEEEESTAPIVEDEIVKKKGPNVWLIVIIVVVALLIIAGVIFLLFRKNKKKKGPNDKDNNGSLPKTNTIKTIEPSVDEDKDPTSITEMLGSDDEETLSDDESTNEDTFTDDRTQRFDEKLFKNYDEYYNDDVEKTKEFDFSDLQ